MQGDLSYCGHKVWFYPEKDEDGKESIFWHLTSRQEETDGYDSRQPRTTGRESPNTLPGRLPDLRRCERLSWIRPVLLRCPDSTQDVLDWDYMEGNGKIRTYVWLHQHDFVIILKKLRDGSSRLITSYHLDNPHQRRKIERKYDGKMR